MKRELSVLVVLISFMISAIGVGLFDSEHRPFRYRLWKAGLHPYSSRLVAQAIISDEDADGFIRGKSKEQIKRIFPDAHEVAINEYQKYYDKELKGREYLWIGEQDVIIFLKNGVGNYVSVMK